MNLLLFNLLACVGFGLLLSASSLSTKRKNSVFLFFSFVSLMIFHSFVDPFSMCDLPVYYRKYQILSQMGWEQCLTLQDFHMEIGYRLFMKTVSLLSTDFTFFLFVYSAILLGLYFFVIKKYSPMVILSIILFLLTSYNQSLFVIRQHLAVALCIATIPLIINRKLVDYLIICAVAFFLHHSAIVFIPLFFLYKLDGKKLIWVIIIVALSMNALFSTILKSFAAELGYWGYIETERYAGLNYINFLISLSFLLLYVFSLKKLIYKLGINKIVFIALAISTMFNLFGVGYAIGRLGIYFSVFTIIALPLSLEQVKNSLVKFIIIIMVLALLFYPMYLGSASMFWEEYRFIWQSI